MNRTGWLGVLGLCAIAIGIAITLWRSHAPLAPCPGEHYRFEDAGAGRALVAICDPSSDGGGPAGAVLALGGKLELNHASEADLALLPGIGPTLAHALVEARGAQGGFHSWDEVDAVPGVGASKLEILKAHADLRP